MTITGISIYSEKIDIDDFDIPSHIMLQVSSWGRKYYISYDEYIKNLDIFSNVLEINE